MYKYFFKRVLDFFVALLCLPILLLIFLAVAVAIKIDDKGPVFYVAKRIGHKGKLFKLIKFRSMKVNAPDIRLSDGSTYNGEDDPRVTKIGKCLRKTSIDELPQVINVLLGQMSFIGPRPDPEDWIDKYTEEERVFLRVRPGITGYNQAYFRNDADAKTKIKNDVYYATNCSFVFDVKIFFKTIVTVFKHENTYKNTSEESGAREEAEKLRLEIACSKEDEDNENKRIRK